MSLYPSSIEGTEYWIVVAGEYELIDTLCHLLRDFSVGFGGNVREPMITEVHANVGSLITASRRAKVRTKEKLLKHGNACDENVRNDGRVDGAAAGRLPTVEYARVPTIS